MATVEIDIDDLLWDMNRFEKQEMIDSLYDEGYVPKQLEKDLASTNDRFPETSTEIELCELLDKIWDNKNSLTAADIKILQILSKKGIYESF